MWLALAWLILVTLILFDYTTVLTAAFGPRLSPLARRRLMAATLLTCLALLVVTPWWGWTLAVIGGAALLHLLSHGIWQWRLAQRLLPADDALLAEVARVAAVAQLAVPPVRIDPLDQVGPALVGLGRPLLVLPAAALALEPAERAAVFAHELAHVRQRDSVRMWAIGLGRTLLGWHPLGSRALSYLALELELAADEAAVAWLGDRDLYALTLGRWGLRWASHRPLQSLAGLVAGRAPLLLRLAALTGPNPAPHLEPPAWMASIIATVKERKGAQADLPTPRIVKLLGAGLLVYVAFFGWVSHLL